MHHYPPAYPAPHPFLTMVGATLQSVLPSEYADASFHTGPENAKARWNQGCSSYSLRFLVRRPLCGKATRRMYPPSLGVLLTLLRVESAVASQQLRRTSEALAVPLDALGQVRVLASGFFEHLISDL